MSFDIIIAVIILILIIVYLIYSRNKFEGDIVQLYDEKLNNWKEHALKDVKKESCKELAGLIFQKDGKIELEVFNEQIKDKIERGKFNIKVK